MWINQLKKDPIHRKIMHTKKAFIENEDFYSREAMKPVADLELVKINYCCTFWNIFTFLSLSEANPLVKLYFLEILNQKPLVLF